MQILPAIDLRGGACVRLRQGDYGQETVFDVDPAAVARRFVEAGAKYLHVVDLDGAKLGQPTNVDAIRGIVSAGVPIQLGGGMRDESHIETALAWGVDRVIIGTRAVKDRAWLREVAERFPSKIVLGIDARDGLVAVHGWLDTSAVSALELARECERLPLAAIVYTDIAKDGMMAGPNFDAMGEMAKAVQLPVIASGGVTEQADIPKLAALGLAGCIVGRALYEGRIDLARALSEPRP